MSMWANVAAQDKKSNQQLTDYVKEASDLEQKEAGKHITARQAEYYALLSVEATGPKKHQILPPTEQYERLWNYSQNKGKQNLNEAMGIATPKNEKIAPIGGAKQGKARMAPPRKYPNKR